MTDKNHSSLVSEMTRAERSDGVQRMSALMLVAGAALAVLALALGLAEAADPPHWSSTSIAIDCTSQCHTLHNALGGQLTAAADNVNLCQSCHNGSGLAAELPMDSIHAAVPGAVGTSHGFGVPAVNSAFSTQLPVDSEMSVRVPDDRVVCSTCHDQHSATNVNGGTPRISTAVKVADTGGSGTLAASGLYSGSAGIWYLVEIDGQGSDSTATFRWSKDNGVSWMGELVPAGGGVNVSLDFGVEVAFSGTGGLAFQTGERWEFHASYPFLRVALDSGDNATGDKFCRDCHSDWVMTHDSAGGTRDYDGNVKSHPVGVSLNANGRGYDRSVPLDANGGDQGIDGDSNSTNDLRLDSGGRVQCLSCHGMHYVDSNSQTVDRYQP